jgi:hypothetical protein
MKMCLRKDVVSLLDCVGILHVSLIRWSERIR